MESGSAFATFLFNDVVRSYSSVSTRFSCGGHLMLFTTPHPRAVSSPTPYLAGAEESLLGSRAEHANARRSSTLRTFRHLSLGHLVCAASAGGAAGFAGSQFQVPGALTRAALPLPDVSSMSPNNLFQAASLQAVTADAPLCLEPQRTPSGRRSPCGWKLQGPRLRNKAKPKRMPSV